MPYTKKKKSKIVRKRKKPVVKKKPIVKKKPVVSKKPPVVSKKPPVKKKAKSKSVRSAKAKTSFERTQVGSAPYKSIFNGIKAQPYKQLTGGTNRLRKATSQGRKATSRGRYRPRKGAKVGRWSSVAPKTKAQRKKIMENCGPSCFGNPSTLGYPVCTTSSCQPDPRGVKAARSRAKQFDHRKGKVGKRARKVLKKIGK